MSCLASVWWRRPSAKIFVEPDTGVKGNTIAPEAIPCSICYMDMDTPGRPRVRLHPCNHSEFCASCVSLWRRSAASQRPATCPMCVQPIRGVAPFEAS